MHIKLVVTLREIAKRNDKIPHKTDLYTVPWIYKHVAMHLGSKMRHIQLKLKTLFASSLIIMEQNNLICVVFVIINRTSINKNNFADLNSIAVLKN